MGCCYSKPKTNEPEQPMNNAMAEKPKPIQVQNKRQKQDPGPNQSPSKAQPHTPNLPPPTFQIDQPQATVAQPSLPQTPPPTLEECINRFGKINNAGEVDYLIDLIDQLVHHLLNRMQPTQEKALLRSTSSETYSETLKDRAKSVWASFLGAGSVFLEFVNKHIQVEKGDGGNRQVLVQILQEVGKVHWVVAGLSVVAFLLDQIDQISDNRSACIDLLKEMSKLAGHIRKLKYDMPQEEKILNEATVLIVEGSMMCASQLNSRTLFRFLKASVDSERSGALQQKIDQVYRDLTLTVAIAIRHSQPVELEIRHSQPVEFPAWNPIYPDYAVGIDEQKKQIQNLLDLDTRNKEPVAVVIYGFGGIGKTTLATAVIADLDLTDYNYSAIQLQEEQSRNDIKSMQQQILKDAFPDYTYGRNITLRNSAEGRDHLSGAFQAQKNKPVFLFIDNALRVEDLLELFPKRLSALPKRSRMVLTTRNLGVTDMLREGRLIRREHCVGTLPDPEAIKILCRDSNSNITDDNKQKMLKICAGIPLVLEIVGARLRKQNYNVDRCTQIFEALESGMDVVEENLSQRLVRSVYRGLEASTQEAFLDICCFFVSWSRHDVECIVGVEEVMHLEEAALFKISVKGNLIVHDIIRAKGMSMSESNRITDMQSWLDVVTENKNLEQIKGVWLSREENEAACEIDENQILSMRKSLRVLALGNKINVSRSGQKTTKFKELRFLRLDGDISSLWPATLESLERLAVFHGPVFKDGVTLYRLPKKVRVMKATAQSRESASSLESMSAATVLKNSSLEELYLQELRTLQRLPERLDHLTALKVLILDEWDRIQELPDQVCGLCSLRTLSICGGVALKNLPESFCKLRCLEELILTCCKKLEELPSTFGELRSLKHLNLAECVSLREFPLSFGKLSSLEVLNLESCWKLEALPSTFGQLSQLNNLCLQSYDLKELPSSFGELRSLTELRCNCVELKGLPVSFGQLTSLTSLDLSFCRKLESLPSSVGQLKSLSYFNLSACSYLEDLPFEVWDIPRLSELDLRQCHSLRECIIENINHEITIWLPTTSQKGVL